MKRHLRVARPVRNLARSAAMYVAGLGLEEIGRFDDHDGFEVFYLPDPDDWRESCARMVAAGFVEVQPYNPYWSRRGRTFEDPDGYRVVLQNAGWGSGC